MQLSELLLNRNLYKTQPQTLETQGADIVSSSLSPAPSTNVASGNTVTDVNTNAEQINGQVIQPGTIPAATLDISNWGWTQNCTFTVTDLDTVSWGTGSFTSANGAVYTIAAGNTGNMAAKTYVYLDINVSSTAYQVTTNPATAVGVGKVLIAVAENAAVTATYILVQATQIVGDNILANTINASKITAGQLIVGTNVGIGTAQDSAGVTTIIGNVVTTGFVNALSITAGSVAAENITGTYITGKVIRTAASGTRVEMNGSTNKFLAYDGTDTIVEIGTTGLFVFGATPNSAINNGFSVVSAVGGIGYYFSNTTNVSTTGLRIIQTSTGGNNSLSAVNVDYAGSLGAIQVANSGTGRSLYLVDSGSSGSVEGIHLEYARSGKAQEIITSNAAATGLYISSVSTSNAAIDLVVATSTGNPVGIRMNISNSGGNEYAFDFQGGEIVSSAVTGTQDKKIRVLIGGSGGAIYYIPLYDA